MGAKSSRGGTAVVSTQGLTVTLANRARVEQPRKIQNIPRPPDFTRGDGPSWCPPPADWRANPEDLCRCLRRPISSRRKRPSTIQAAVLCLLYRHEGDIWLLLTRRAAHLRSHSREVSFPGGRLEPGESPEQAALREAHEEVGLHPDQVTLLGTLSPLSTRRKEVGILPCVGWLADLPEVQPNHNEVEKILPIPIHHLWQPGVYHQEIWNLPDWPHLVIHFFDIGEDTIWGATAHMIDELLMRLLPRPSVLEP